MLILPSWLIPSAKDKPLADWGVRIFGSEITTVAPNAALRESFPEDEVWEAAGQILAPGFVDTHTHLYGILAHGIPLAKAPSGFMPFLEDFWWPLVENRLEREMIGAATDANCAALIRSGVHLLLRLRRSPQRPAGHPGSPGRDRAQARTARHPVLRSHATA